MVNIGTRLKKLRTENKLTQTQVAEIFGLGVSSISSYESGDRKPSYAILRKYAAHFHVSTDYILGIDEYSRAVTPQVRQAGNRLSGLTETAYASLLA